MRARVGLRGLLILLAGAPLLASCGGSSKSSTTRSHASFAVLIGAGIDLLHQGNSSAAEQLFEQAIAREPNNPVGHYDLGVVAQASGDRRTALREYRRALASDPHYTPALFNEAVMIAPRDPALAIYYYREIIEMKPNSPTAFLNLGLLQERTGWPRRFVVSSLRRAVTLDHSLRGDIPPRLRHELESTHH